MGAIWSEIVRWIGVSVALAGEGPAHLTIFKNIVPGNVKSRDRIGVIWFTIVSLIWKVRNEMICNQAGFEWENVL
jgi:hypothetical protein